MRLHIALQEGFEGDTVQILVDEQEVLADDKVRTRTQIGLARTVELDRPSGTADIDVRVPRRGIQGRLTVDLQETPYVGVSLSPQGQVVFEVSRTPFLYA